MAVTKYLVFRGGGRKQLLLQRIKDCVRNLDLGMEVPLVKFEPRTRGEFYYGIAVSLEDPGLTLVPDSIEELINVCGLPRPFSNLGNVFFEQDEIKSFLAGQLDWESFNEPLIFECELDDLPDFREAGWSDGNEVGEYEQGLTRLLWWCSAKGEGSFNIFSNSCHQLGSCGERGRSAWSVMRKLVLLGHVEYSGDARGLHWGMVPTTLVSKDTGEGCYYLVGSMSPAKLASIHQHVDVSEVSAAGGPTHYECTLRDREAPDLATVLDIELVESAAHQLADRLPLLETWRSSLRQDPDIAEHRYEFRRHDGAGFKVVEPGNLRPGLYEVERIEGDHPPRVVLFDGENWRTGNFYDLRFLAYLGSVESANVRLDDSQNLVIPEFGHWPLLYERALVLASGRLPRQERSADDVPLLVYGGITRELAEILCTKLTLNLKD